MPISKQDVARLLRTNSTRLTLCQNEDGRSAVWNNFRLIKVDGNCTNFVACVKCHAVYGYNKKDGTSNLKAHKCNLRGSDQSTLSTFCRPSAVPTAISEAKRRIATKAALCAALDFRPYNFVEGEGFQLLAQELLDLGAVNATRPLQAQDVLPCGRTVSREAQKKAEERREQLRQELKEMTRGAVTTDGWTCSTTHQKFISVTLHHIISTQGQLELKSMVLGVRSMEEAHTSANILAAVGSVLDEFLPNWEQEQRIIAFVTDNAANMRAAFNKRTWIWLGCACHQLHLAVKSALEPTTDERKRSTGEAQPTGSQRISDQLKTCKQLVSLVRRKGLDRHLTKSLKQDCETRWHSTLVMVQSVLEALEEMRVHSAFTDDEAVDELLVSVRASTLRQVTAVLEPFMLASNQLSSERTPTLHLVVPFLERLERHL